jgi:N-methylhydantoinase A
VHAFGVARILRSPSVIYPLGAGVMSAVGFLVAPLSFDFVRTLPGALDTLGWDAVAGGRRDGGRGPRRPRRTIPPTRFASAGSPTCATGSRGTRSACPSPTGARRPGAGDPPELRDAYRAIYGHTVRDAPIEAVSWPGWSQGPADAPAPDERRRRAVTRGPREGASRLPPRCARIRGTSRLRSLRAGRRRTLEGRRSIEERESTVVVSATAWIRVDDASNVIVEMPPAAGDSRVA